MSFARSRVPRILGALLAAILVVGLLGGCGGGSQSVPQSSQPATSTKAPEASKPAESAKPAQSSAPAASAQPLKIGVNYILSGPSGAIGTKHMIGLEMAVDEINAAGGIMGRKVELVVRDDGGDPTKTLSNAQELVEKQGISIIMGATSSSQQLAMAPYTTDQKVFDIGSFSADSTNDPVKYPYAFTISPLAAQQAAAVVKYAVQILKAKNLGILADTGAYGKSTTDAFLKALESMGAPKPVAIENYAFGAADMTAQLNNLKKAGVEAILTTSLAADTVRILKNMKSIGWDVPYLGSSDLASSTVVEGVGAENMGKVYGYYVKRLSFSDKIPVPAKTKEFAAKLAKKVGQNPLKEAVFMPSFAYDEMYLVKKVIEETKSTDGPKLAAALENVKNYDGVHANLTFSKEMHGGMPLDEMVMVKAANMKDGFFELAPGY